ncbi:hypothetical protein [Burkholderia vietnamiensis]|uniref:hypothetical protein n=1 Tax=Burkholderia vietnamiensis TaxID=60552 RepID=UPI001593D5F7|nr:hypothetical protein [Burkholderia vietnamiensis]
MDKINHGGPAFPVPLAEGQGYQGHAPCDGMTLRDYFAGQALNGALSDPAVTIFGDKDADILASAVYRIADAMLRARGEA